MNAADMMDEESTDAPDTEEESTDACNLLAKKMKVPVDLLKEAIIQVFHEESE